MRLTFYGATESVTGSCFLVETSKAKILVDCGAVQGERMCSKTNLEEFQFDPASIDAVLVTHAHFDHTGRLPKLVKDGFKGKIFCTPPTKSLAQIVLDDSLSVMRENAAKCGDPVPYEEQDVVAAMARMSGIGYHTQFELARGLQAMFHDAGHILGSSFVSLDIPADETTSGRPTRLVFSGDIGNDNVPILPDTDVLEQADIVVCESTYGGKDHDPVETRGKDLADYVNLVIGRGGTLLIPAFSVERTQELLYELDLLLEAKKIPAVPIYLDSPLAIKATEIYRHFKAYLRFDHPASQDGDFFSFKNLRETLTVQESTLIDNDRRPKIVIAGNGMMTGGRILRHLQQHLGDAKSGVLIIGYQAAYSLGRRIQEGAKEVTIHEKKMTVAATVRSIEAFSAHGDRAKLARWLHPAAGNIPRVFLTHGENETKEKFADYLHAHGVNEVTIPRITQTFEF